MTKSDVDEITTVLRDWMVQRKREDIGIEERFLDSSIFDSLDVMELVLFCEGRFAVAFGPEDLRSADFGSLTGLAKLIAAKKRTYPTGAP